MTRRYSSIVDMMRDLAEDASFAESLAEHLAQRRLVTDLVALRAANGLTQQDVATKLDCTQGRISKVEASTDGALDMATLVRYADAIGYRVEISLVQKNMTLVDRVKQHALSIKRLTDATAKLGSKDRKIAEGVGEFLREATFNLVQLVKSSARYLPATPEEPSRPFVINVCTSADDEERCEAEEPAQPSKRKKRRAVPI